MGIKSVIFLIILHLFLAACDLDFFKTISKADYNKILNDKSSKKNITSDLKKNLDSLKISNGILSPKFNSNILIYNVNVNNEISEIGITPFVADNDNRIEINNTAADSGYAFGPIHLDIGENSILITVIAQDESEKSYRINVNRNKPGWQDPVLLENENSGSVTNQRISMNASGNAVVVWQQGDGKRQNIWANHFERGTGWKEARLLETDDTGSSQEPAVAIDDNGNAIVVWDQSAGKIYNIYANHYIRESGWQGPVLIEKNDKDMASLAEICIKESGDAIAVWRYHTEFGNNIYAAHFDTEDGWQTPVLIEADRQGDSENSDVAVNSSGFAVAVWDRSDKTCRNIWANSYIPGSGWTGAQLIESRNDGDAIKPQIVLNESGQAIAAWEQNNGIFNNIWINHYSFDSGWESPVLAENVDKGDAQHPKVTLNDNGLAIVVWEQSDGGYSDIWYNKYIPDLGWQGRELVESFNAGSSYRPSVAIDSIGNIFVVWHSYNYLKDLNVIWAKHYEPAVGWIGKGNQLIQVDGAGSAKYASIAMDENGKAIAVWSQLDGTRFNIWANYFD